MTCRCGELGAEGEGDEEERLHRGLYCLLHPVECAEERARARQRKLRALGVGVAFLWLMLRR